MSTITVTTLIKENLIKVKALINDPKHWIQGEFARDATGSPTLPYHKDAICFCLEGAVEKVIYTDFGSNTSGMNKRELYYAILHHIENTIAIIPNTPSADLRVPNYNDSHTHTEVLTLLDKAIALCN